MIYLIFSIIWYIQHILQLLEVFYTETNNSLLLVNLKQNFLLIPPPPPSKEAKLSLKGYTNYSKGIHEIIYILWIRTLVI